MALIKLSSVRLEVRALLLCSMLAVSIVPQAQADFLGSLRKHVQHAKNKFDEVSQATNGLLGTADSTIIAADGTVQAVKSMVPGASGDQDATAQPAAPVAPGQGAKRQKHTPIGQKHSPDGSPARTGATPISPSAPPTGGGSDDWGSSPEGDGDASVWGTDPAPADEDAEDWGDGKAVVAVRPVITLQNQSAVQGQAIRLASKITAPDGHALKGVDVEFVVHDEARWHSLGLAKTDANGVARISYVADAHFPAHKLSSKVDVQVNVVESDRVIQGTKKGILTVKLGAGEN